MAVAAVVMVVPAVVMMMPPRAMMVMPSVTVSAVPAAMTTPVVMTPMLHALGQAFGGEITRRSARRSARGTRETDRETGGDDDLAYQNSSFPGLDEGNGSTSAWFDHS